MKQIFPIEWKSAFVNQKCQGEKVQFTHRPHLKIDMISSICNRNPWQTSKYRHKRFDFRWIQCKCQNYSWNCIEIYLKNDIPSCSAHNESIFLPFLWMSNSLAFSLLLAHRITHGLMNHIILFARVFSHSFHFYLISSTFIPFPLQKLIFSMLLQTLSDTIRIYSWNLFWIRSHNNFRNPNVKISCGN